MQYNIYNLQQVIVSCIFLSTGIYIYMANSVERQVCMCDLGCVCVSVSKTKSFCTWLYWRVNMRTALYPSLRAVSGQNVNGQRSWRGRNEHRERGGGRWRWRRWGKQVIIWGMPLKSLLLHKVAGGELIFSDVCISSPVRTLYMTDGCYYLCFCVLHFNRQIM